MHYYKVIWQGDLHFASRGVTNHWSTAHKNISHDLNHDDTNEQKFYVLQLTFAAICANTTTTHKK